MGGLRTGGDAEPMDAETLRRMGRYWENVAERTELGTITRGFTPWEQLEPALTQWLEQNYATRARGLVCDPDTGMC